MVVHQTGQVLSVTILLWSLPVSALFSACVLGTIQPGSWCNIVAAGMLTAALLIPFPAREPCHLMPKESLPMFNTSEKIV